jgi:hypothetical protein
MSKKSKVLTEVRVGLRIEYNFEKGTPEGVPPGPKKEDVMVYFRKNCGALKNRSKWKKRQWIRAAMKTARKIRRDWEKNMTDIKRSSFEKVLTEKSEIPPKGSPEVFQVPSRIGGSRWLMDDYASISIDGEGESYIKVGKNEGVVFDELAFCLGKAHAKDLVCNFLAQAGMKLDETGFGYKFPTGAKLIFLPEETIIEGMEKLDAGTKQFIKGAESFLAEFKQEKK